MIAFTRHQPDNSQNTIDSENAAAFSAALPNRENKVGRFYPVAMLAPVMSADILTRGPGPCKPLESSGGELVSQPTGLTRTGSN